ncbi:ankyrin repeat domain-containing protein [Corallococcus sp. AB050B]|nr:ankyrin repeat domain-containing protein [Corallococcus sp. AB050B]
MANPLFDALENNDLAQLSTLLSGGADPDALRPDATQWRPLHAAIEQLEAGGSMDALVLLLRQGASVDAWDGHHDATPLLMALFRDQREATRLLLAAGADPTLVGAEGDSPLRWCVERRDHEMAALLLRCGAARTLDEAGGPSGMTALGRAASQLDVPMMQLLLEAGAEPAALDADRRTARERRPPRTPENAPAWDAAERLLGPGA